MFTASDGKQYRRIYHYHIRKTGGTSLNKAFLAHHGQEVHRSYKQLVKNLQFQLNGFTSVGWNRGLLSNGNYDFGFSHIPKHQITLPNQTYTVTIFRDPTKRVISHYRMLVEMRETSSNHPAFRDEGGWISNGFSGFIEAIPAEHLKRQLFMFSKMFDLEEALAEALSCNKVIFLENYAEGLAELSRETGYPLEYSHDRQSKIPFEMTETDKGQLRELLEDEYRFLDQLRERITGQKTAPLSVETGKPDLPATEQAKSTVLVQPSRKPFPIPVAVVAYNRLDHTVQVLEGLKDYGVQNLYLFSDAPRNEKDVEAVDRVRELFRSVDWAKTEVVERKENLGLKRSVIHAANHVFERHETMLLLEDDIVPFPTMFPFIEEGLLRYRDDPKVAGISGFTPHQPEEHLERYPYDAYFFHRMSSWAWATWKREWTHFQPNLVALVHRAQRDKADLTLGGADLPKMIQSALNGKDIWTVNWVVDMAIRDLVFVYPTRSHINNIGMDGTGQNTGRSDIYNSVPHGKIAEQFPKEVFLVRELVATHYNRFGAPHSVRNLKSADHIGSYPLLGIDDLSGERVGQKREKDGMDVASTIRKAMELMTSKQHSKALELLNTLNGSGSALPNHHLLRAFCLEGMGDVKKAMEAVETELAQNPASEEAIQYRKRLASSVGNAASRHVSISSHSAQGGGGGELPLLKSPSILAHQATVAKQTEPQIMESLRQVERLFEEAASAFAVQDYNRAFQSTVKAKALHSLYRGLDLLRAKIFLALKQNSAAHQALLEELRLFPENAEAKAFLDHFLEKIQSVPPETKLGDSEFKDLCRIVRPFTMLSEQRIFSLYSLAREACAKRIPGNFVECGVAGGGASALLAFVVKHHSHQPRKVFSFDSYEGMPAPGEMDRNHGTGANDSGWGEGTCAAPVESLLEISRKLTVEKYVNPVKGLFEETLPEWRDRVGMIALLHADGDWYSSTRAIFNSLYDRLSNDAFVQVDDFGHWEGARQAVEEFAASRKVNFTINKIDYTGVWFKKPDRFAVNPDVPAQLLAEFEQDDPATRGIISQMSANERFQLYAAARTLIHPKTNVICYIEIGSWEGASLRLIHAAMKHHKRQLQGIAIDLSMRPQLQQYLNEARGEIHFLQARSEQVVPHLAELIQKNGVRPEFTFIDGDHTYEGVRRDIENYWPLLAVGGIMVFHDYLPSLNTENREAIFAHHAGNEPGIRQAVEETVVKRFAGVHIPQPLLYPDDPTQTQAHLQIIPGVHSTLRVYRKDKE